MRALIGLLALLPLAVGCSEVRMMGAAAMEKRRVMNDMQARATMAAVCDISLGAYMRELNETERTYAGVVCGDVAAMRRALRGPALPERLLATGAH